MAKKHRSGNRVIERRQKQQADSLEKKDDVRWHGMLFNVGFYALRILLCAAILAAALGFCFLPEAVRTGLVSVAAMLLSVYLFINAWKSLPEKDKVGKSAALAAMYAFGGFAGVHLLFSRSRAENMWPACTGLIFLFAAYAAILWQSPAQSKKMVSLCEKTESLQNAVALLLVLRFMLAFGASLSFWGKLLLFSVLPALILGGILFFLAKKRGALQRGRMAKRVGTVAL